MSRSVHRTLTGAFSGKLKFEVDDMIQGEDEDVLELVKKWHYKRSEREIRQEQNPYRLIDEQGAADKGDLE